MPELSPSTEFLDEVQRSVREALAALDRDDALLASDHVTASSAEKSCAAALNRLEDNLVGWRAILDDMALRVRSAQEDLSGLDTDLKRSLDTFATARKHLQGDAMPSTTNGD
ncbi:MAG TPA: hypothetical protein VHR66_10665 [Gemmataceae bacterium]|jgi:hypothetical protein|nr:hypothetical protein [Gemmataceae bacterium]